jgi:hypothetical protein
MLRVIVLDANIIIEFERIKEKYGDEKFGKDLSVFIKFCNGQYIMIPLRVKKELRNSSIIEAFNHVLKKSVRLSICEISNKREIGEFLREHFNNDESNMGEADALNQITKYRDMNEESKLRIFGYGNVEFIFVSNDRRALEVAGDLGIRIIKWEDFTKFREKFYNK